MHIENVSFSMIQLYLNDSTDIEMKESKDLTKLNSLHNGILNSNKLRKIIGQIL